jgi:hypothetical protein
MSFECKDPLCPFQPAILGIECLVMTPSKSDLPCEDGLETRKSWKLSCYFFRNLYSDFKVEKDFLHVQEDRGDWCCRPKDGRGYD